MNEGKLLQAVLALTEKFEKETILNITLHEDVPLDILQFSNLHKMDMILSAVDISSNVDVLYQEKEAKLKVKPDIKEAPIKESAFYEKCVFKIDPEGSTKKVENKLRTINKDVNDSKAVKNYRKGYYFLDKKFNSASDNINDFIKDIFEDNENYDLEGCLNCRRPADINGGLPPFEVSWEIKKFLESLKGLLTDIKLSLDNTKQIADICKIKEMLENSNGLCLSSYPLILASFPIIISDIKSKLFEVGVSWTGLVGSLLMPVLKVLSKVIEMLKGITIPIFDCLINSFKTMKSVLVAADQAASSIKAQALRVGDTFGVPEREDIKNQIAISEKVKQNLKYKNQKAVQKQNKNPSVEPVAPSKKNNKESKKYGTKIDSEEYLPGYKAGVYTSTNLNNNVEPITFLQKNPFGGGFIDIIIDRLGRARVIVNDFFSRLVYTLRAFQRVIIEPLYVSTKLISEIRVLANLGRLIKLLFKLSKSGLEICKDFDDNSKNNLLKQVVESSDSDIELDFVKDESGETFALVKSKTSEYKSRLRPNNCGEITIDINSNQNSLDLVYDHLANSLGAK
jgi:hypothetical protein